MAIHLVTGYAGAAHVTSADSGALNAGIIGGSDYVLNTGTKLAASIISNNKIRITDGDAIIQGRHVNLKAGSYEDVSIANGAQGQKRNDIIVLRYKKETSSGVESASLAVLQGVSTTGTAADPSPTTGNILEGDTLHEMPLYRVRLNGLTVESVSPMFNVIKNMSETASRVDAHARIIADLTTLESTQMGNAVSGAHTALGEFTIRRMGNLVVGHCHIKSGLAPSTPTVVGTLSKFKPVGNQSYSLIHDGGTVCAGNLQLGIDGKITVTVDNSTAYMSATFVYFTDDI